jgi:hypothetical protein
MLCFEDLIWYIIALFLLLLGAFSILGGEPTAIVWIFGGCLILIGKHVQSGLQRQKQIQTLVVYVPIQRNTPEKVLPLLLNCDDAWIVSYLKKHGKTKEVKEGITLQYRGRQIYFPTKNFFLFKTKVCQPNAIKIVTCGGFDVLTATF